MPQLQIYLSEDNQVLHDLTEEKVTLGRLADNTLQIDDASVSSHHAEILFEGDQYHVHDLGSTNGTFVNGEQVTSAILAYGDEVRFGRMEAVFSGEEEGAVSQPLPESQSATATVATQSARPVNFVRSSPVARNERKKDLAAFALYGLAVLGILTAGAAAYFVSYMSAAS